MGGNGNRYPGRKAIFRTSWATVLYGEKISQRTRFREKESMRARLHKRQGFMVERTPYGTQLIGGKTIGDSGV